MSNNKMSYTPIYHRFENKLITKSIPGGIVKSQSIFLTIRQLRKDEI